MDNNETWQDVFLTKPEYGGTAQGSRLMDDVFVAPVMSVDVRCAKGASATTTNAKVVKGGSNWLALAFPGDASGTEIAKWRDISVGDMIRVGTAGAGGFTDYLTVLETIDVDRLYNTTSGNWQIVTLDPHTDTATVTVKVPDPDEGRDLAGQTLTHIGPYSNNTSIHWVIEHTTGGLPKGSLRCVRINYSIDASTLDTDINRDAKFLNSATDSANFVTDATRGEVSTYYPQTGTRTYVGANRREMFYYPCYRQRGWGSSSTVLRLQMPTNIKQVRAVKLMGYSLFHKRTVGTQQQHEYKNDDWLAIRIKELRTNDNVLSNNRYAEGALHILNCGTATDGQLYAYEPQGLACASFTPVNLPSITVEVIDRQGQDAHLGRTHLWLRVLVTHG